MRDGSGSDLLRVGGPDDEEPYGLGGLVAALRRPADLGSGVDVAVMAAIHLAPAPLVIVDGARSDRVRPARPAVPVVRAGTWRWFTRSRAVSVSPLGAVAAAGIAIAAVFGLRREAARRGEELARGATGEFPAVTGEYAAVTRDGAARATGPAPARDTVYVTRFMLIAPGAKHVALVGDFNGWDHGATPLTAVASSGSGGVWTVDLHLTPGRYTYAFLVDGKRWVADPRAPRALGDDFGRPSSMLTVRAGSET